MVFYRVKESRARRKSQRLQPGQRSIYRPGCFGFIYDAKTKDKLPYWDKLPLVVPFNIYDDGFIGLNLHYAAGEDRKRLLQYLLRMKAKRSKRDYVKISYQSLQVAVKTSVFGPCVHRYLSSHLRSRLIKIDLSEWENVASLPLAQWQRKGR